MNARFSALFVLLATFALNGCVVAGGTSSGSDGSSFFFLLAPIFLLLVMWSAFVRPRRRRRHSRGFVGVDADDVPNQQMLKAELSVLSDDVLRLEPQVTLKPEARDDFEAALHRYRVATTALEEVDAPIDLVRVQRVVDEATWSMARARATLDGRPLPPPPATLQRPGRHGEPAIDVDSDQPVYVGSPATFRSGWFGGGGLFGGLVIGSILGGYEYDEELDQG